MSGLSRIFRRSTQAVTATLSKLCLEGVPTRRNPVFIKIRQIRPAHSVLVEPVLVSNDTASWSNPVTLQIQMPKDYNPRKPTILHLSFRLQEVSVLGHRRLGVVDIDVSKMFFEKVSEICLPLSRCDAQCSFRAKISFEASNIPAADKFSQEISGKSEPPCAFPKNAPQSKAGRNDILMLISSRMEGKLLDQLEKEVIDIIGEVLSAN